ncbi:MAG: aminoglycoside phosphotransferase family protein [Chloroflexi bacterium]|nr:aminoglycoside phosphotransferase family protein [Chloroflexota bacterium]
MNLVLDFLERHRARLKLDLYRVPERLTSVMLTPRFRASRHVVFLILPARKPYPVLVAKVPRLGERSQSLTREAAAIEAIQKMRPGGFDTIPQLIAFEDYRGYPLLIETALNGPLLDPPRVRRDRDAACELALDWLTDLPRTPQEQPQFEWYEARIAQPLNAFAGSFPLNVKEEQLLIHTQELITPLKQTALSPVVEHGDVSHPNLITLNMQNLGVVDWELAEIDGIPACDMFFFLTYAAFAQDDARTRRDFITPFNDAFFGPDAWAVPFVKQYAQRMQIAIEHLTPLFVLCWARYMSRLLLRLYNDDLTPASVEPDTAAWLRENRYYALWRHTLNHLDELGWMA